MAEKGATQVKEAAAQAKEAVEKVSAATSEAANVMQNCYSAALKGVQDYNNKWMEFTQANTQAVMDFAQRLSGAKSPSEFIELSTVHTQQQLTTLTEQTKQLTALAQQVALATTEPLKSSSTKTSAWS